MQASQQQRRFAELASACALCLLAACRPHEPVPPKVNGDVKQGRALLARFQCGACHAIPGVEGAVGTAGPPLADIARRSYLAGHVPNDPDNMVRWIVDPRALVPATTMPAMGVSTEEARHIAAYLYTLQ